MENKIKVAVCDVRNDVSVEDIQKLVNAGTTYINEIDVTCFSYLYQAVGEGYTGIVRYLLENETYRNIYEGNKLIYLAAEQGHLDILKLLVSSYGVKCLHYSKYNHPIHFAAANGKVLMVECLLEIGTEVNFVDNRNRTPLHKAAQFDDKSTVELLLKNKADIDPKDEYGCTPLHYAVIQNNLPIIDILIEWGADVNMTDLNKRSPLDYAAENNCLEALRLLLKRGANLIFNGKFQSYRTLLIAAQRGLLSVILEFISEGVDINVHSKKGHTLLHAACRAGQFEVARCLLQNGANVNSKSKPNDITPMYFAVTHCQPEIIRLLISYGGLLENPCKNETVLSLAHKEFNSRSHYPDSSRKVCLQIIIKYWLLLSRVPILPPDLNFKYFPHFHTKCREEISLMKFVLIGSSSISVYKFLRNSYQNDNTLVQYLQNEDICRGINIVCRYLKTCEIYSDVCITSEPLYKSGMERRCLLHVSYVYFKTVSPFLPAECWWKIFSCLSNADLKNFIRSFKENFRYIENTCSMDICPPIFLTYEKDSPHPIPFFYLYKRSLIAS
ncbi:putative ankyrin repeat protein RF_0381 [Diabrotica virgifera virgifera]|uniref:Uncharacterized protein LOC114327992 n=1 Tax=Diabrotica virgifera virgifera TaxID=50390 RepID=A0A6P7FH35_DIAVI|nr:putative ankyrin repeat protein RF_0381 [Diabrotica virgifera virgifera]